MTGDILTMPRDLYHADPLSRPSLSASIAHILCARSPLHAWAAHPKLNPDWEPYEDDKFSIGTVAHAMLLEGHDIAVQIDAPDWRTNAAKEARDAARAAGRVPLLAKDWDRVQTMIAAVAEQLAGVNVNPPLLADGKPEQTLVWEEPNGVLCRARLDWLRDDHKAIDDIKTTSRSADPETFSRTVFNIGADVQTVFYKRAVRAVTGVDPDFRFIVAESHPPYAVSVVSLAPSAIALAESKVEFALTTWARCLATGIWPGYGTQVAYAEAPGYAEAQWFEREDRQAA